jgi:hypothetical protein
MLEIESDSFCGGVGNLTKLQEFWMGPIWKCHCGLPPGWSFLEISQEDLLEYTHIVRFCLGFDTHITKITI